MNEKSFSFDDGVYQNTLANVNDFVSMFDEADKYYAAIVFVERLPLTITKIDEVTIQFLKSEFIDDINELFSLVVSENKDFFIMSAEKLDIIKQFCDDFGFQYDDQSRSSM